MFPDETNRLNSWKAIAAYLERDVRTVQLWEKEQALPVHRQRHAKLSSVFAYKSELDRWRLDRTQGPKHSTVRQKPLNDDTAPLVLAHGNVAVPPTSQTAAASAADLPSSGLGERRWPVLYKWTGVTLVIVLAGAVASGIVHWNHQPGLLLPGPHTVPVTTLPGVETMPAFSPDGRHLAYVRAEQERRNPNLWRRLPGPSSIYVKLLDAGTELRLTRSASADSFPAWSPDGRYIAFFREGLGASGYYIVSARGGPERRIPGEASSSSVGLDWSPDGKSLIVSEMSEKSQASPLVMISIDTGQRRTVTSPPKSSMGDLYPRFSPDGQWLAYIRVLAYGNADIWVTPAKGGASRQWTADQAWKEQFSWWPDSRGIVFPVLQPSTGGLWQISLAGEGARAITLDGQEMAMPTLARRGHRLAYVLSTTSINLWRIDLVDAGRPNPLVPRELIVSTRRQFDPQYSPDGKVIAFLSDRSGSEEIWTAEAEGERPLQLTHFSGPPTGSPSWSPDGSEIAFDTRANGNPDIWVVKRDGGVPQRITNSHAEDVVPSWSHDGQWIYFASNRGGDFQIWKVARAGESPSHPAVQVTKHGGFCSMETPDGKYLYFSKGRGHDGLWRRSTDTEDGKEEPIVPSLQHWGWWTLAPQGILFFEENGASVRLMLSDLLGLLSRPIGHWNASLMKATRVIAVTPDGGRVTYAQIDQGGADIMAIENFRSR